MDSTKEVLNSTDIVITTSPDSTDRHGMSRKRRDSFKALENVVRIWLQVV